MTIAWNIERHAEVESTNALALERVRAAFAGSDNRASLEGLVIAAERQRHGRGQHGRAWESPQGGLYLSAVVEHVPAGQRGILALIAGVAVAQALEALGQPVKLQWPNDLVIAGGFRKLGGILCEAVASGSRWAGIIGIGLNVNTRMSDLPAALRVRATSLLEHTGRRQDPRAIEQRVLTELGAVLQRATLEGIDTIVESVRERDALRGQWVQLQNGDEMLSAAGAGIGDGGQLLLDTTEGVRAFATGTIVAVNGMRLRH